MGRYPILEHFSWSQEGIKKPKETATKPKESDRNRKENQKISDRNRKKSRGNRKISDRNRKENRSEMDTRPRPAPNTVGTFRFVSVSFRFLSVLCPSRIGFLFGFEHLSFGFLSIAFGFDHCFFGVLFGFDHFLLVSLQFLSVFLMPSWLPEKCSKIGYWPQVSYK